MENENDLNPNCFDTTNLTNAVNDHQISAKKYGEMVSAFCLIQNVDDPDSIDPKVFQMNDSRIDLTMNCEKYGVKFSYDHTYSNSDDIVPSMDIFPEGDYDPGIAFYSIQLLNGLKILLGVDSFDLRKGIEVAPWGAFVSVVLRAYCGTRIVYHGDLTSMIPFIGNGKKKD